VRAGLRDLAADATPIPDRLHEHLCRDRRVERTPRRRRRSVVTLTVGVRTQAMRS
jgi:hypothetical protein